MNLTNFNIINSQDSLLKDLKQHARRKILLVSGTRPEAVEAGTVKLVGTDYKTIVENVNLLINDKLAYNIMSLAHNPYGDGKACKRIVDVLMGN